MLRNKAERLIVFKPKSQFEPTRLANRKGRDYYYFFYIIIFNRSESDLQCLGHCSIGSTAPYSNQPEVSQCVCMRTRPLTTKQSLLSLR